MTPFPKEQTTKGKILADYMAYEREFKGIGPRRSAALLSIFGDSLKSAVLDIDQTVIDTIGELPAINASAVLQNRGAELDLLDWLYGMQLEFSRTNAIRIARAWGNVGLTALRENPYLLLGLASWSVVDRIAKSEGISETDIRRQIGAIETVLSGEECLGSGSTSVSIQKLVSSATKLLGYPIFSSAIDETISKGGATKLGNQIQPPGAAYMEAQCALKLAQLILQPIAGGAFGVGSVDLSIASYEKTLGISLSAAQISAIRKAHLHRFMILGGYAGSGKTTVLKGICDTLEEAGKKPLIITLSGRAAQRASEATGRRAQTVARFLIERSQNASNLTGENVLIVDEASMLGLVEVWRILRKLGDASLILCGDPAQLPPVSSGVVFHTLVEDPKIPRVILDRVHRQEESTGIPAIAEGVREGKPPLLTGFDGVKYGVTFSESGLTKLCDNVLSIGSELRKKGVSKSEIQIIAPTNREISKINSFFHRRLLKAKGESLSWSPYLIEDEPVIWTKNDADRDLTNGALGRIVRLCGSEAIAEFDGVEHKLTPKDSQNLQLAWAISVHKAQGSQWSRVIIPVFQSRILDRSLIYTALTRAQHQIIFLGSREALNFAISQPPVVSKRNCGFPTWLHLARTLNSKSSLIA